jgi:hypothetical protein
MQLTFGCGKHLLAGIDASGREFEEKLSGSVTVLTNEEDLGVVGVGGCVDREDDDRAVVADDVATGVDAAGLNHFVRGDGEDFAFVDSPG